MFALAGVTGAILVFYVEADAALHPVVAGLAPAPAPASYEAIYQGLRSHAPKRAGAWRIEAADQGAISARYYKTQAAAARGFAPLVVWSDPVSGKVVRQAQWGETLVTWIYDLHYALLIGPAGKIVMAGAGLLCLVLLVGGVWLWWPANGKWRGALTVKPAASAQRRIYDLHKAAGVYGLVQLTIVTLTGVMLGAPAWFAPVLSPSASRPAAPIVRSASSPSGERLPVDQAISLARARFPDARLRWIETPDGPQGVYRINLRQPGEPSRRFPRTNVWLDQYSGQILAVRDPRRDPPGQVVSAWLHPLHSGEAGGLIGRLIVLATGLGAPALFVTGGIRGWHKRRARLLSRARGRPGSGGRREVVRAQGPARGEGAP